MLRAFNLIPICLAFFLTSCTYLKYSTVQADYTKLQRSDPSQVNLKHMLSQDTYFTWGKPKTESNHYSDTDMAIAAYSSQFKEHERVDTMFFNGTQTHYALNLPEGAYTLLIYADGNGDGQFHNTEVVGQKELILNTSLYPDKLAKNIEISISEAKTITWGDTIMAPNLGELSTSLYYPAGTIRTLDDAIFDNKIATMGMYDPASFLEVAPTMFYALSEDEGHKIPVIFVHGIDGSSRSFQSIVDQMGLNRYQPWFFYYPSGADLDQFADFFYSIFLSGDVVLKNGMPMIVVAHSMGGLIVREAFNRYQASDSENTVGLFVSIATPFGGHPSAVLGEEHGLIVLPAWRDLNPSSSFISNLYQTELATVTNHQLFYAYNNASLVKMGENSDGVVPLSSQLHPEAQRQSLSQFGFNSTHTDILENQEMITHLLESMATVENIFPESHMNILKEGGFDLILTENYSPETQHLISYAGKYLVLLVQGHLKPINQEHQHFIDVVNGKAPATRAIEKEFILFMQQYPELVDSALVE